MTYDMTATDIQCHADKDGAKVYEVEVTGWNNDTYACKQITYRVLSHDEDYAVEAASLEYERDNDGYLVETAELL